MNINSDIKNDIDNLINVGIKEIESAFKSGNAPLYGELGEKYGPKAHRIYMHLDAPCKSSEISFFDERRKSVLLDPWTVPNRLQSFINEGKDVTINDPEFWNHSDMVKTLVDYLLLTQNKGMVNA
jgi:hypothetical protein